MKQSILFFILLIAFTVSTIFTSCGTQLKIGVIPIATCILQNIEIVPNNPSNPNNIL